MLFRVTEDHYQQLLQERGQYEGDPGKWVGRIFKELERKNPIVFKFLIYLKEDFSEHSWFIAAFHCAVATYRLLEIAADGELPLIKDGVGDAMQVELKRNLKDFLVSRAQSITAENPRVLFVTDDYSYKYLDDGGDQSLAWRIPYAGIVMYQYFARQHEADELGELY